VLLGLLVLSAVLGGVGALAKDAQLGLAIGAGLPWAIVGLGFVVVGHVWLALVGTVIGALVGYVRALDRTLREAGSAEPRARALFAAIARGDTRRTLAGLLLVVAGVVAGGVVLVRRSGRIVDRTPAQVKLVDLNTASYGGLKPGETIDQVRRRLGRPLDTDFGVGPIRLNGTYSYKKLTVWFFDGFVTGLSISDPNAQTQAGVGNGGSLGGARRG